ncbi:ABC transporter permease [Ornithinibacillus scapharcae]|uniref:ABC transporter permease n=1 Tax=Ornithinibacillus scapharcae TaxID=1147159 RepID=UPI000225B035|nr:ABC transporter permease [Ornithinibacillus scapharcae]
MSKLKFKRISVVFKRDYNEFIKWKSYNILLFLFGILIILAILMTNFILPNMTWMNGQNDDHIYQIITFHILLLLAMAPLIISIPLFTSGPFTREKANGVISALLSTQLRQEEIWLGKSFAVFVPTFTISFVSSLIATYAVSKLITIPAALLFTIFLITPLMYLGLTIFTVQLSMILSSELSIAPSYLVGMLLLIGIPVGSLTGYLDISSWKFSLLCALLTVFTWILVWFYSIYLTKERIILSK